MVKKDKKPKKRANIAVYIRSSSEEDIEDNWGQWLKATLEDRGVGDLFESISGMVNKVLEKQTALFKVVAADT